MFGKLLILVGLVVNPGWLSSSNHQFFSGAFAVRFRGGYTALKKKNMREITKKLAQTLFISQNKCKWTANSRSYLDTSSGCPKHWCLNFSKQLVFSYYSFSTQRITQLGCTKVFAWQPPSPKMNAWKLSHRKPIIEKRR